MTIEIRPCTSVDEFRRAVGAISHYFGGGPSEEQAERFTSVLPIERMHAALERDTIVGGAGAFPFELTVPGGSVAAAGVTVVGVLPTHRRRGVLTALMRAQLDDVRGRNEHVAYLWASEETIYGRFGYGPASFAGEVKLARERTAFAHPFERRATARLVNEEEALEPFAAVYDAVRAETPGMFARSEAWWRQRRLSDPESRRRGRGELSRLLLERDGRPDAYGLYRVTPAWEHGSASGSVEIVEAMGATPEATRELWRFLLDLDWTARFEASLLPVDHPLFFFLAEPRRMRFRVGDALWVRLVDVAEALAARSYRAGEAVVLEVADDFCPWNNGRYRVADGGVERTEDEPDVCLDAPALGSVFLGGFTFAQLARALRVAEARPGGVARADALFATDRAPWCPEIF